VSALAKILKYLLIALMIATGVSCAAGKKNPYMQKKKQNSKVSTSQLGRNKYYFSPEYQKKLNKNFKK
jgi:hypothetical protein